MQAIDIFLIAFGAAILWESARSISPTRRKVLAWLAIGTMAAQIYLESSRWQLYPVYAAILLGAAVLLLFENGAVRGFLGRLAWVTGLAFVVVSGFLCYALPVPVIPAPRGPYAVGTTTWEFDDNTRKDPYAPSEQPRRIILQAWYPAQVDPLEAKQVAPWCPDINVFGPAIAKKLGLPSFLLSHLTLIKSHSIDGANLKVDEGKWPVIVYSHGWTGFRTVALDEVEALASQGYVVFAPDHTYGALATVLKDGTPVLNNPKAMPPDEPRDETRQKGIELLVDTYAGDLRFVLDTIETMNTGTFVSQFKDHLDLTKVGLFGHSTGGGAIYEVAATDPRVKCAFGLDTWTEPISPDVREKPLTVPFFSLRSAEWALKKDEKARILEELLAKAQGPKFDYYLVDSKHADFTLTSILSPFVGRLGMTGPIDGGRALEIGDKYLVAFFDQYLRGKESPLMMSEVKEIPEVRKVVAAAQ